MFVYGLNNPVYTGVTTDSLMLGVYEDDFEVFVG